MADKLEIGDEMLTQVCGGAEAATAEPTFAEMSREIRERFIAKYGLSAVVKTLAAHPEIVEMLEDETPSWPSRAASLRTALSTRFPIPSKAGWARG